MLPALAIVATDPPESPERPRQPQACFGSPLLLPAPLQGGPQIIVLALEALQPLREIGPQYARFGRLRQLQKKLQMPITPRFYLSGLPQPLPSIRSDRLQQTIPRPALALLGNHQRLVYEGGQKIEDIIAVCSTDGFCRFQRPTAGKHAEPRKQLLLVGGEKIIAPVQGGLQGLLTGQGGAAATRQQTETVCQARGDLLHR